MATTRKRPFLIIPLLALLGVVGWVAWSEFAPTTTQSSEQRLRFVNISVALPNEQQGDHSALRVSADYAAPESGDKPGGGPIVTVSYSASHRYLVIDAVTGEVVVDRIGSGDRAEADTVVDSIRVEQKPAGVWPVAGVAPAGTQRTLSGMSYMEPDPSSGIFVAQGIGDGPDGGGPFLFVHNGRSRMTVDGRTGEADLGLVTPDDREAFERFAGSVAVSREP